MITINPLDHLNKRKLNWIPVQFSKTKISQISNIEKVDEWIKYRLSGRYCIASYPHLDRDEKSKTATFVAFEEEKELTYFMLACPYLRSI